MASREASEELSVFSAGPRAGSPSVQDRLSDFVEVAVNAASMNEASRNQHDLASVKPKRAQRLRGRHRHGYRTSLQRYASERPSDEGALAMTKVNLKASRIANRLDSTFTSAATAQRVTFLVQGCSTQSVCGQGQAEVTLACGRVLLFHAGSPRRAVRVWL